MTDPDRKPETTPEGEPAPREASTPGWVDAMTSSPEPVPARPPETPVAEDVFAGPAPTPPAAPVSETLPVSETYVVRPEGSAPTAGLTDPAAPPTAAASSTAPPPGSAAPAPASTTDTASKKVVAGILGILLGSLGIHKFYLGIQQPAIIMLCITLGCWLLTVVTIGFASFVTIPVLTAMGIIGLVEGIIYLTKTDEQFRQEYEIGKKPWF